jgi:hypothetical protein
VAYSSLFSNTSPENNKLLILKSFFFLMEAYQDTSGYHTYIDKKELKRFRKEKRLTSKLIDSESERTLGRLHLRKGDTTNTTLYESNGDSLLTISKAGSQQLEEKGFFDSGINGPDDIHFNLHMVVKGFNER